MGCTEASYAPSQRARQTPHAVSQLLEPNGRGVRVVRVLEVPGEDADVIIDATIAQYAAIGCKFVWRVGPTARPPMPARLARRGLVHGVACGMARSTEMARPNRA